MKKLFFVFLFSGSVFILPAQSDQSIHRKALVVDTHNDFISTSIEEQLSFDHNLRGRTHSICKECLMGIDAQVFSIFCDDSFGKGTAFAYANREIDSLYAIAARNPDKMEIVTTPGR